MALMLHIALLKSSAPMQYRGFLCMQCFLKLCPPMTTPHLVNTHASNNQQLALQETIDTSGFLFTQYLVVTCFYTNIQRTFTGVTKPQGTSVYLKAGLIRNYLTSLTIYLASAHSKKWITITTSATINIINTTSTIFAIHCL